MLIRKATNISVSWSSLTNETGQITKAWIIAEPYDANNNNLTTSMVVHIPLNNDTDLEPLPFPHTGIRGFFGAYNINNPCETHIFGFNFLSKFSGKICGGFCDVKCEYGTPMLDPTTILPTNNQNLTNDNYVMEFIDKHFSGLFNYSYTKEMEDELDKIAKGHAIWYNLCETCNKQIDTLVDGLKDESKIEVKLDDHNTYLVGKYGPVIKCVEEVNGIEQTNFKAIKKDIDIHKIENGDYNQSIEEIIDTNVIKKRYILGQHEGKDVVIQKGKFGLYITWDKNSKTLKEFGNRPIENITFDEVQKYLEEGSNLIREVSTNVSIRKGPKGDYIFYKTAKLKKPQFFDLKPFQNDTKSDYKTCNITVLKSWLKEKYDIF